MWLMVTILDSKENMCVMTALVYFEAEDYRIRQLQMPEEKNESRKNR